jgi:hypothetical protein
MVTTLLSTMVAVSGGVTALGSVIGFFVWILILVWIFNIARRKGRHAVGWLILGLFFSLITLIVVALLPSKRTTEYYEGR